MYTLPLWPSPGPGGETTTQRIVLGPGAGEIFSDCGAVGSRQLEISQSASQ